jgi:hypothetical protein
MLRTRFARFGPKNLSLSENGTTREKGDDYLAVETVTSELLSVTNREKYRETFAEELIFEPP